MNKNIETVLVEIAKALNASHAVWGVGASLLLNQYGLTEKTNDIDITVSSRDIAVVDQILSEMGTKQPISHSDIYATDYFYEYIIGGINVDVMAGLKINTNNNVFEYPFDKKSVQNTFTFQNTTIPFSTLEDWYVLYQLMPDREFKVKLIAEYFNEKGIEHPDIFERMSINPTLPIQIRDNILSFIQH